MKINGQKKKRMVRILALVLAVLLAGSTLVGALLSTMYR